jgi:hypothetical protein
MLACVSCYTNFGTGKKVKAAADGHHPVLYEAEVVMVSDPVSNRGDVDGNARQSDLMLIIFSSRSFCL